MGRWWRVSAGAAIAVAALGPASGGQARGAAVDAGLLGMVAGAVVASGGTRPYPAGYAGYYAPPAVRGPRVHEAARAPVPAKGRRS